MPNIGFLQNSLPAKWASAALATLLGVTGLQASTPETDIISPPTQQIVAQSVETTHVFVDVPLFRDPTPSPKLLAFNDRVDGRRTSRIAEVPQPQNVAAPQDIVVARTEIALNETDIPTGKDGEIMTIENGEITWTDARNFFYRFFSRGSGGGGGGGGGSPYSPPPGHNGDGGPLMIYGDGLRIGGEVYSNILGNLGVGKSNPQSTLDVSGTISGMSLHIYGVQPSFFLGNLGIGTKSPETKLEVIGTGSGRQWFAMDHLASSGTLTIDGDTRLRSDLYLGDDETSDVTHVKTRFSGSLVPLTTNLYDLGSDTLRWRDLYLSGSSLHMGVSGDEATIGYNDAADYLFLDPNGNGTPTVVINDAGNVGIGIDTPVHAVDAIGTIHASETLASSGTLVADGNAFIGDAATDTISASGRFITDLVPLIDSAVGLGSDPNRWTNAFVDRIFSTLSLSSSGTLSVEGLTSLSGDTDIGDAFSDTVTFNASVDSHIIPETDNLYDLGSALLQWRDVYTHGLNIGFETGSVIFTGTGGELKEDNTNFFWDQFKNRLGIKNNNPSHEVDVTGTIHASDTLASSGTLVADGNVSLGDAATDTISASGRLITDLIPLVDSEVNIGSDANRWADAFVDRVFTTQSLTSSGTLVAEGKTTLNGDVTMGDATTDAITASGRFVSDLLPMVDDYNALGSDTNRWRDLFLGPNSLDIGTSGTNSKITRGATGLGFDTDADSSSDIVFLANGNVGIGVGTPVHALQVSGTIQASDTLASSGTLVAEGATYLNGAATLGSTVTIGGITYSFPTSDGSATGKVLKTDGSGNLSWSDDIDTTYEAGQGLTLNGTLFTLNGTLTGALLDFTDIHADDSLTSSGTLVVEGTTTLNGAVTLGSTVTIGGVGYSFPTNDGSASGKALKTDSSGNLSWSDDVDNDTTYVAGQGLTLAGGVFTLNGSLTGALLDYTEVHADDSLTSSGTLVVEGATTLNGAVTLGSSTVTIGGVAYSFPTDDGTSSGKVLKTDGSGNLSWSDDVDNDTTYVAGQGLTLGGTVFALNGSLTGSLLDFTDIHADDSLTSSGTLVVEGLTTLNSDVGIGVAASAAAALTIATTDGDNHEAILIDTEETTGTQDVFKIVSDVAGDEDPAFRIQANGEVFSDRAYHSKGADYAEWFPTRDSDLQPGELVCIDISSHNSVERCTNDADGNLMGIVSTNPAFIGNSAAGANGMAIPGSVLIGLIGQVPANVTTENGEIRPGDALTSANQHGFARRADPGEPTVGIALEGLSNGQGTVNVLISRRNSSVTVETVEQQIIEKVADLEIEDEVELLISSTLETLDINADISAEVINQLSGLEEDIANVLEERLSDIITFNDDGIAILAVANDATFSEALSIVGPMTLGSSLSVARSITTQSVTITDGALVQADLEVQGALEVAGDATIGGTLTVGSNLSISGALIINGETFDPAGGINLEDSVELADLLVEDSLVVMGDVTIEGVATLLGTVNLLGETIFASNVGGSAIIPSGGDSVFVELDPPFSVKPVVTVTPTEFVYNPWRVRDISRDGFWIEISTKTVSTTSFAWHAVAVADASVTEGLALGDDPVDEEEDEDPLTPFYVDEENGPLTDDPILDACVRGHITHDDNGEPYSCTRYSAGPKAWNHPDGFTFKYNPERTPAYLEIPDGYKIVVLASDDEEEDPEDPADDPVDDPVEDPEDPADDPVEDPEDPTDDPVEDPEDPADDPVEDPEDPVENPEDPVEDPEDPVEDPVEDPEDPVEDPVEDPEDPADEPEEPSAEEPAETVEEEPAPTEETPEPEAQE